MAYWQLEPHKGKGLGTGEMPYSSLCTWWEPPLPRHWQVLPCLGIIDGLVDEINLAYSHTNLVHCSTYQYIPVHTQIQLPQEQWGREPWGQSQHEHLHTTSTTISHLGVFLSIYVMSWKWALYSMDSVIMEVSATTLAKLLASRFHTASIRAVVTSCVHKVSTQQDLGVTVQLLYHNVITKKAQIPANITQLTSYIIVHASTY